MNKQQISRFFRILSKEYHRPCTVILTGAGAGAVYGNVRATMDIDFCLVLKSRSKKNKQADWREFEEKVKEVTLRTNIAVQYAEDIDRWSQITYLDYQKHTILFKKFGSIEVRLLDPLYWAIGKMTRFLAPDVRDMIHVFKKTKTSPIKLAALLGKALRKSPRSTMCTSFRRQVELFFEEYGATTWGKNYSAESAVKAFRKAARIKIVLSDKS
ncbi:MAG: hypothetical protein H6757_06600 [Candidatus Omnitrophica bacterium]|nr:hypothetical protein [Candidatus Omnitrophota bacterium]